MTIKTQSKVRAERDKAFLLQAPEICIFMACSGLVDKLRALANGFERSKITRRDYLEQAEVVLVQLAEAATATERFDIVLPVMGYGRFSPFFWKWFNWWDDYVKERTPRQLSKLELLARERKTSINRHRPKDDWMKNRATAAFLTVD